MIFLSGNVEVNSGPKIKANNFSVCCWNINSISVHNYSKVSLLKAYLTVYKFDIVCLSETYLDSNTAPDIENLKISGYNLIKLYHPSNSRGDGVQKPLASESFRRPIFA